MFRIGPRIELDDGGKKSLFSSVLAILIGVGLIGLGFNTFQSQNQALENPVNVTGTVTDTAITEDSSRRGGIDYQPEITFEYSFEGRNYSSSNMYPGGQKPDEYNLESGAREIIQKYSQGSKITVFVPPKTPGEAFLKNKKSEDPLFFIAIGALFTILGARQFLKTNYI